MGHIISLWETISVELARLHWQKEEEPFEAIPDGYKEKLADDQQKELDKCLRMFDLDLLLGALFEFIEIYVKHITTGDSASRYVNNFVVLTSAFLHSFVYHISSKSTCWYDPF